MSRRDLRNPLRYAWKAGLLASCLAITVAVVLGLILSNPPKQPDQYLYGAVSAPPQPDLSAFEPPKIAREMPKVLSGSAGLNSVGEESQSAEGRSSPQLKVISSGTAVDSEKRRAIVGILENQGGEQYQYIQVSYRLYNSKGMDIGTASATALGLEPHGIWRFSTAIDDDCAKYKLDKIEAW